MSTAVGQCYIRFSSKVDIVTFKGVSRNCHRHRPAVAFMATQNAVSCICCCPAHRQAKSCSWQNMLITRPSNAFSHRCLLSSSAGKRLRLARLTRTGGLTRAKGVPPLTLLPGSGLTATTISLQKAICRLLPLLTSLNAIHMTVHRMSAHHMTAHHMSVYHMIVRGGGPETTQNG